MRYWIRKLLDRLRPLSSGLTPENAARTAYFRFAIVWIIVLAIGPELIVLLDLAALVSLYEILGGALFVAAYVSGAKLLALDLFMAVRNVLRPLAPLFQVGSTMLRIERVRVFVYVSATTAWSLAFVVGF